MTSILRPPQDPHEAIFELHALTDPAITDELRHTYGDAAVEDTIESFRAFKGEAIANSMSAPETYQDFVTARTEYLAQIEAGVIPQPKRTEEDGDSPIMFPSLGLERADTTDENTLTPEDYAKLGVSPRKETIQARPEKETWDDGIEKDTDKPTKELTPKELEIVAAAVKKAALHPARKGDDVLALSILAEQSPSVAGAVSRFILETAKSRRRTRAFMTGLLLRIV